VKPPLPPLVAPAPLTSFVGRDGQADNVAAALAAHRLVTLHGPAGVGKSRLAQEVARVVRARFPDGVWWVDLTVVNHELEVPARVAHSLGVSAILGTPVETALVTYLEHRQLLLVLDNCEHVAQASGELIQAVLQAAPGLRVLATSRLFLGLPGEARWEVPPLTLPREQDDETSTAACDAVALLQQCRGRHVDDPSVETLAEVGRLCHRLDGLPLAIELAAAHTQQMTIREILDQLGREELESQTPSGKRHASLAQAIDWSYDELDSSTQRLFDRLSVFPGDFDAAAVDAIAADMASLALDGARTHLATLVGACLVEANPLDAVTRYRLLFVMREFAGARLAERGETDAARGAFADHYRQLAVRAGPGLLGHTSGRWLRRLRREWVNLQGALTWSMEHDSPARTLEFVRSMGEVVWAVSPELAVDVDVLHRVLQRAEAARAADTAWGLQALVGAAYIAGDVTLALEANDRAERLFVESGDAAGLACVYWHGGGTRLLAVGNLAAAERLLQHGQLVAQCAGVAKPEAFCRAHLVQLHCFSGTVDAETQRALQAAERLADPDDIQLQAHLRLDRALLRFAAGDMDACMSAADTCMEFSRQTGIATYEQAGHLVKGGATLKTGDPEALTNALRAARIAADVGLRMRLGLALQQLARLADSTDDPGQGGATLGRRPRTSTPLSRMPRHPCSAPRPTVPRRPFRRRTIARSRAERRPSPGTSHRLASRGTGSADAEHTPGSWLRPRIDSCERSWCTSRCSETTSRSRRRSRRGLWTAACPPTRSRWERPTRTWTATSRCSWPARPTTPGACRAPRRGRTQPRRRMAHWSARGLGCGSGSSPRRCRVACVSRPTTPGGRARRPSSGSTTPPPASTST